MNPRNRSFAIGNIYVDARRTERFAGIIFDDSPAPEQPVYCSIGPARTPFPFGRHASLERSLHERQNVRTIFRMEQPLPVRFGLGKGARRQPVHRLQFGMIGHERSQHGGSQAWTQTGQKRHQHNGGVEGHAWRNTRITPTGYLPVQQHGRRDCANSGGIAPAILNRRCFLPKGSPTIAGGEGRPGNAGGRPDLHNRISLKGTASELG
jgi:hypothetical protein